MFFKLGFSVKHVILNYTNYVKKIIGKKLNGVNALIVIKLVLC